MSSPDWIQALQAACKGSTQAAIARQVGISPASLSLILRDVAGARTPRMESKVRAALLQPEHTCPVLGRLTRARCLEEQQAPYYPTPIRSDLYRACRACEHALGKEN